MRVRVVSSVFGAFLAVLAFAPVAQACSCAAADPRDRLDDAAGAFIGRLVSRDPAPQDAHSTTYHFKVDEVFKGDIGSTVDVESSTNGASCGFEVAPGEQMGFLLERSGAQWHGGLCGQIDPEELRGAAKPLPAPDGTGPLTFLIGGSFGEMRTIGLDAQGRTLKYGTGGGHVIDASVCPGSRFAVEVVSGYGTAHAKLAIRDLETFEVVRDIPLDSLDVENEGTLYPAEVTCRDGTAEDVLLLARDDGQDLSRSRLMRFRRGEPNRLWEGHGGSGALPASGQHAYLAGYKEILEIDISTKETRRVADVPASTTAPSSVTLSPDAKSLAVRTSKGAEQRGHVIDIASGTMTSVDFGDDVTGGPRAMIWASDVRIVAYTGGGDTEELTVFDRSLKKIASWTGWYTSEAFIVGETIYGVGWGKVYSAPYMTGPVKKIRTFDSPETYALTYVPPRPAPATPAPASTPEATPTSEPSAEPSAEPTATPASFSAPTSEPSAPTSSAVPAVAVGSSALALAAGAIALRRRTR
jgi:hypothetical protein